MWCVRAGRKEWLSLSFVCFSEVFVMVRCEEKSSSCLCILCEFSFALICMFQLTLFIVRRWTYLLSAVQNNLIKCSNVCIKVQRCCIFPPSRHATSNDQVTACATLSFKVKSIFPFCFYHFASTWIHYTLMFDKLVIVITVYINPSILNISL